MKKKRHSCQENNDSKSKKSSNQTNKKDDEKSYFHICWIVAVHLRSRNWVKNDKFNVIDSEKNQKFQEKKNHVWKQTTTTTTTTTKKWKSSLIYRNNHEKTMISSHSKMMKTRMRSMRNMRNKQNMKIMISQSITLMLNFCSRIFLIACMMNKHFKI